MNYKVTDIKVFPTFIAGGKLAVAYVRKVEKESADSDKAASAFSASLTSSVGSLPMYNVNLVSHQDDRYTFDDHSIILVGTIDDTTINAAIDVLTEGMKEGAAKKVRDSLVSSVGVTKGATIIDNTDIPFSEEEKTKLVESYDVISAELEKMREGVTASASKSKLEHYAFRKHLLIQGEKGGGKTYMVDKLIKDKGYTVEFIGGHEAILVA